MTQADLHQIPKFAELFEDARFKALIQFRREHIGRAPFYNSSTSEAIIHSGGYKDGWLDGINSFEELRHAPRPDESPKKESLYSSR